MSIERELLKVKFTLSSNSWHGTDSEGIWTRLIERLFDCVIVEIDNNPFFTKGVSFGDRIVARFHGGDLNFENVVEHSGNSTYRIFVERETPVVLKRLQTLKDLGCDWENTVFNGGLLRALNVPSQANIQEAYGILEYGQRDGAWLFEEGHVGHSSP